MKLTFWGATDDVTGSMTFFETSEGTIAIDAGLNQGSRIAEKKNWLSPPVPAKELKAVILTHAHLDHCGYLPRLIREGFSGEIYCTPATSKLARIILHDSASLNEDSLYDDKDVQRTLNLMKLRDWNKEFQVVGADVTFFPAGHILGASSVKIRYQDKTIVFSGDLGRNDDPLMKAPEECPPADIVVMESTYGDRKRQGDLKADLVNFLRKISKERRVGIIASFAVARAQNLIDLIHDHFRDHPEDKVRVVLDSPMMIEANQVYKAYSHLTLDPNELSDSLTHFEVLAFERQWKSLARKEGPLLVLASSGMLTGGRIKRHLRNWQDDPKAVIFLPGYQGKGTPGRKLLEGERILDMGDEEPIHWQGEVVSSDAFSSHADQEELIDWLRNVPLKSHIFLIHGDESAKIKLQEVLKASGREFTIIPKRLASVNCSQLTEDN